MVWWWHHLCTRWAILVGIFIVLAHWNILFWLEANLFFILFLPALGWSSKHQVYSLVWPDQEWNYQSVKTKFIVWFDQAWNYQLVKTKFIVWFDQEWNYQPVKTLSHHIGKAGKLLGKTLKNYTTQTKTLEL